MFPPAMGNPRFDRGLLSELQKNLRADVFVNLGALAAEVVTSSQHLIHFFSACCITYDI